MTQKFADALIDAQGRSEFVMVVVADIRGFSAFSTVNESPNIAMFIKRFYLQLINEYFTTANFVKPTGDGLLMTFPYSETTLLEVAETVINSCLSCLSEFQDLCNDDPMINFPIPQAIGFGVARGTACCLYSGDEILDYSGHLLNLASRLNDLARPSGIVIDGGFLESVIPEASRELFKEQTVYIRSIAEDTPARIFYLDNHVKISETSLSPLTSENWQTIIRRWTKSQYVSLSPTLLETLPMRVKSLEKLRVTITYPKVGRGQKGILNWIDFKNFEYFGDGPNPTLRLDIGKARSIASPANLKGGSKITFRIEYVPMPLARTK